MANYSAADVKKLREATGAGFMDCKKALEEAEGDFDKATEILRIKGNKDAGKRAERTTAEGMVATSGNALIELNSETDFVAKNSEFSDLAQAVAGVAGGDDVDGTVEAVLAAPLGDGTVADAVQALSSKIGEKLVLNRVVKFDGSTAVYLHKRNQDLPPSIGVLVAYTGEGEEAAEAARGAAMQISALRARFVTRDEVPADVLESERRIAETIAREEGKPEAALSRIVDGRVTGFYKEAVLVEQSSVRDSKKTVGAQLAEAGVTVTGFARFEVGTV